MIAWCCTHQSPGNDGCIYSIIHNGDIRRLKCKTSSRQVGAQSKQQHFCSRRDLFKRCLRSRPRRLKVRLFGKIAYLFIIKCIWQYSDALFLEMDCQNHPIFYGDHILFVRPLYKHLTVDAMLSFIKRGDCTHLWFFARFTPPLYIYFFKYTVYA